MATKPQSWSASSAGSSPSLGQLGCGAAAQPLREASAAPPPGCAARALPASSAAPDEQVELLSSDAQLREVEGEWRALYAHSRPRNPFVSYDWVLACRAHVAPGATPYVLTARRAGRLVGLAPLRLERRLGVLRVLRFMGDGRSDYQGFLLRDGEPGVEALLLQALAVRSGEWDLALLRQLADGHTGLHRARAPGGLRERGSFGTVSPYLHLPEDWRELCERGPTPVRRAVRAQRKFLREGGSVERMAGEDLAPPGAGALVEALAEVERRSWKVGAITRFQSAPNQALIRQTLSGLGPRGEVELWLARMDGRPVAFLLNFVTPHAVWFYQGAYDEQYRRYFPCGILHYRCLQRLWEAGLREYDLLSGDEPYKRGWASGARELRYRALFPASPRGSLAYGLLLGARWELKKWPQVRAALRRISRVQRQHAGT